MAIAEMTYRPGLYIIGGIKVVVGTDLNQKPYNVHVSPTNLANMYAQMGFSPVEIARQELLLKGKYPSTYGERHDVAGTSHPTKPIVTLYTDWAWRMRQKDMSEVKDYIKTNQQGDVIRKVPKLASFQSPYRVERYLNSAPPDRAVKFMQNLVNKIWNDELNSTLIHELQHQKDTSGRLAKLAAITFIYGGEIMALFLGLRIGISAQELLPHLKGLYQPGLDAFWATAYVLQPSLKAKSMLFNPFENRARKAQRVFSSTIPNVITLEAK